jgi:hypothetical protein
MVGVKIKKAPGLAGQEKHVGAYRQVATHVHVREVNKSVAALPDKARSAAIRHHELTWATFSAA